MITMEMLGKIRRMYFRDKLSLHEITKRTGLSRRLTRFHAVLKQALKADAHRAKQNRRTAKSLFAQIKADGYVGGKSWPLACG